MQSILQDLRFGARALARNKAFTAVAVLTLALGIGANTAIFSVVNAVLLESVPYKDPGKLVFVWSTMISQGVPISGSAAPDFREWRTRNHVFAGMVAYTYENYNLALPGEDPSRVQGAAVSPETFSLLGVNPVLGRTFLPEETCGLEPGSHREVKMFPVKPQPPARAMGLRREAQDYSFRRCTPPCLRKRDCVCAIRENQAPPSR